MLMCLALCALIAGTVEAAGSERQESRSWLKIYYNEGDIKRINANPISEIDSICFTEYGEGDGQITTDSGGKNTKINVVSAWNKTFSLDMDSIESMVMGVNIPTLYIDTDPYVDEITSKEEYLKATLRYIPYGDGTDTLVSTVSIRGRGNSSWFFPKKPYRLKFDKKQSLAGLNKAKSFVLLSNYIDNTLMKNAVAMKVAELLEMPYTNRIVPVNLVFNGEYRGNYMLTNKVGINSGSVDIDEDEGILWELDTNFDEEFKFRSPTFNQPCMVKDPDFHELYDDPEDVERIWQYWQDDLEAAFQEVEKGNWRDVFDEEQFIKYFIVQSVVQNTETEFPKSFYIYKETKDGKYKLGPVWDFDWAMGYSQDILRGVIYRDCGSFPFLGTIFQEQKFQQDYIRCFKEFCNDHLDEVLEFIDDYAALIRDSAMQDAIRWPAEHHDTKYEKAERNASRFDENVEWLKDWVLERIDVVINRWNYSLW